MNSVTGASTAATPTPDPAASPTPTSTLNIVPTIAGASGTYQNNVPGNVLSSDPNAIWSSGAMAPQYITFNFGQKVSLNQVSLQVVQNPSPCQTRHEFYGGMDETHMQYVGSLQSTTSAGQTITLGFSNGVPQVQYLEVLTTQSCSWVAWGKIQFQVSAPQVSDPSYFVGYFANAIYQDYTSVVSDHNNTLWVTPDNAIPILTEMQLYASMRAIVSVSNLFFDGSFNLLPNYAQNWAAFAQTIQPYASQIAAFYPLDEPFLNGSEHGVSQATMKANLETIIATIKASFPNKPNAVIFSVAELKSSSSIGPFVIPTGYDWVSFDCYGLWENCGGSSMPQLYDTLKAAMTPNQRLMVIGDSVLLNETTSSLKFIPDEVELLDRVSNDYNYFMNEPLAVGFFPFIWQSTDAIPGSTTTWVGAADMPLILPQMKQNSKSILDKNTAPTF